MRRVVFLATAVMTVIVLAPSLSIANGGATFDFGVEEPYLLSDEPIQGTTVVWLGKKDVQALQEGPYYAYVVPDGKWIEPPNIPAEAIRVGTIEFEMINEKKAVANLSFVAPDLPSGRYALPYCNDPCTQASVGDLYVDSVLVARDAEAGALLVQTENAEAKASSFQWRFKRAKRQIGRLEETLGAAEGATTDLRGQVMELQGRLRTMSEPDEAGPGMIPWVVAGIPGLAAGLLIGRRRRTSSVSPVRQAERILERVS